MSSSTELAPPFIHSVRSFVDSPVCIAYDCTRTGGGEWGEGDEWKQTVGELGEDADFVPVAMTEGIDWTETPPGNGRQRPQTERAGEDEEEGDPARTPEQQQQQNEGRVPYTYEVKRKDAAGVTRTVKMAGQCALEDPVSKLTVAQLKACFAALDRVAAVQRTPPTGNKKDLTALLQERRLA